MDPEHVRMVKERRIAEWRLANPGEKFDLTSSYFFDADLSDVDLSGSDLVDANLSGADLSRASLVDAILVDADLRDVDFSGAELVDANLRWANLAGADLTDAYLTGAIMLNANLAGATLTGANLYGTARYNWMIEGVICDYLFWDRAGAERSPKDRDLELGEFERLYAQLPTIEYVFENGFHPLDPVIMDRIVQMINERSPEFDLHMDAINTRGIRPTITFNVKFEGQKRRALEEITQAYDLRCENAELKGEIRGLLAAMDRMPGQTVIQGSVVALPGGQINIQEYIGHLQEIQQAIEDTPAESLTDDVRQEALDAVTDGIKEASLGNVKKAAKGVTEAVTRLGIGLASRTQGFEALVDLGE